jgi:hypothetical protein
MLIQVSQAFDGNPLCMFESVQRVSQQHSKNSASSLKQETKLDKSEFHMEHNRYYVMEFQAEGFIVLLNSLRGPGRGDGWMLGKKFNGTVSTPVEITAKEDFDDGMLLPLYPTPTIMRNDLHEAVVSVGVDNLDVWDAIVRKADGTLLSDQYKAFNVIGLRSVGPGTVYMPENPSRMVDASIESLQIGEDQAQGLLLFRLAQSMDIIVVHEKVKTAIEARNIPNIIFIDPQKAFSI